MPDSLLDATALVLEAFEQSPVAHLVIVDNGSAARYNTAARGLLGITADESPGFHERLVPEDRDAVRKLIESARLNPAESVAFTCRIAGRGGQPIGMKGRIRAFAAPAPGVVLTLEPHSPARVSRSGRLAHLYAAVNKTLSAMLTVRERATLLEKTCQALIASGDFCLAWIGWVDKSRQTVDAEAVAGVQGMAYPRQIHVGVDNSPHSLGPTGRAVRTGRPQVCLDIAADPLMAPWREQALQAGFRSSAAIPLRVQDEVVGTINFYSLEPNFFGPEEMSVLSDLAGNLSLALERLELERKRRQAEAELEGREKIFRSINQHIQDTIWILDMNLRTVFISPSLERVLGHTLEELQRQPFEKQLTRDSYRNFLSFLSRGVTQETLQRREETLSRMLELEFIRKDGTTSWGEIQITLIRDHQGTADGFLCVGREIFRPGRRTTFADRPAPLEPENACDSADKPLK